MDIRFVRIDDRLIHGQVATAWSKQMDITRILVVSDEAAENPIRKLLLKHAAPTGIFVNVLSVSRMMDIAQSDLLSEEKVALLFTTPKDLAFLVRNGLSVSSINIGGMSFSNGKKMITSFISVDQEDITSFGYLSAQGIELEIRKVPTDLKTNLTELLKKQKLL